MLIAHWKSLSSSLPVKTHPNIIIVVTFTIFFVLSIFEIFINGIMQYTTLTTVLFSKTLHVRNRSIHAIAGRRCLFFHCSVIFYFPFIEKQTILLILHYDRGLGCFQFRANINKSAMSILAHMLLCLWYEPETKLLGHSICFCSAQENTTGHFSNVFYLICLAKIY